jgi:hypothetical protein
VRCTCWHSYDEWPPKLELDFTQGKGSHCFPLCLQNTCLFSPLRSDSQADRDLVAVCAATERHFTGNPGYLLWCQWSATGTSGRRQLDQPLPREVVLGFPSCSSSGFVAWYIALQLLRAAPSLMAQPEPIIAQSSQYYRHVNLHLRARLCSLPSSLSKPNSFS